MRTYLIITWSVFQKLFVWQVVFLWNNGSQFYLTEFKLFQNLSRYKRILNSFVKTASPIFVPQCLKNFQRPAGHCYDLAS